jgi:diacylglycerol kinase (ATP)
VYNFKTVALLITSPQGNVCTNLDHKILILMAHQKFTTTGILRVFKATSFSFKGIKRAWKTEAAVRQELTLTIILLPVAFCIAQSLAQVVMLVFSLFIVVITELLNTSIEYAIDRIGSERNDLSGASKDIASAAVFFSLAQVVFVWITIVVYNLEWLVFPIF